MLITTVRTRKETVRTPVLSASFLMLLLFSMVIFSILVWLVGALLSFGTLIAPLLECYKTLRGCLPGLSCFGLDHARWKVLLFIAS